MQSFEGRAERILISDVPRSIESRPLEQVRVTLEGFEGDKHAGFTRRADARTPQFKRGTIIRNSRQVSIVSREELAEVAATLGLPKIEPKWLGANLLFSGVPNLSLLPPGTRLYFPGGAVLVVEGENDPCVKPGRVLHDLYPEKLPKPGLFPKAALHKRGLVGWVERAGIIRQGDPVKIVVPVQVIYRLPGSVAV